MRMRIGSFLFGLLYLAAFAAHADADAKPKVYALISAVGSEISYVRQRLQVGSNLEPYYRSTLPVPDSSVDMAVLRGLERAILQEDPDAKRVYMRLAPTEVRDVLPYKRGDVVPERALAALAQMPDRKDWDRIILVTPSYLSSAREGLGTKLHGIGVYVQPLGRGRRGSLDLEMGGTVDPDTVSPEGAKSRSNVYIAPYFYAQVWIIDAKTMQVLETRERYDFQRLYDPNSAAIDVAKSIPVEQLAAMVQKFIERASAHALNESIGEVIVKELKVVDPPSTK